jgi:hypothetical protein
MFENLALKLGCKPDTIVTVTVTLAVFTAGILVNAFINYCKSRNERQKYRKYINTLIDNIKKYSTRQSKELDKSLSSFVLANQNPFFITELTENSLNLIDKISFDKVYAAFLTGLTFKKSLRIKALNCILNQTALIKKVNENIRIEIDELDKKFHTYELSWNNSIESIRKIYDNLRQQNASGTLDIKTRPFLIDMDRIVQAWSVQKDRAHRVIVKNLIVDKLDSKFFEKHKSLEIAITVQNYNIDAIMSYLNMEHILSLYRGLFSTYSRINRNYNRIVGKSQRILQKVTLYY